MAEVGIIPLASRSTDNSVHEYLQRIADRLGLKDLYESFENSYTNSQGLRINMEILRAESSAPVVIVVPGVTMYALCYARLMKSIHAQGYNVIGMDPRGHGRSDGQPGDYTFGQIVRDIQSVVTWAILNMNDRISVLGSDQGGVAGFYAAAGDDRIKSVITKNMADLRDPIFQKLEVFKSKRVVQPLLLGLGGLFPNMNLPIRNYLNFNNAKLKNWGTVSEFMKQDPLMLKKLRAKNFSSILKYKSRIGIENCCTPTFILQAEDEPIFPLSYTEGVFAKLTCKKKLAIIEGKNQTMLTENPEDLVPLISDWLVEIHGQTISN